MSGLSFSGDPSVIRQSVSIVSPAVAKRTTLPVLSCIRVQSDGTNLTFTSYNLDQLLQCRVEVSDLSGEPGGYAVAADTFNGLLAQCSDSTVHVSLEKNSIRIEGGNKKATIPVLPLEEFPDDPELPARGTFEEIDAESLHHALVSCCPLAGADESRHVLVSVFFDDKQQRVVATDGKRLGVMDMPYPEIVGGAVVPIFAARILEKLLKDCETCRVYRLKGALAFWLDGILFHTRLIEASYPNYGIMLGEPAGAVAIQVPREELLGALSWVSAINKGDAAVASSTIKLSVEDRNLNIQRASSTNGSSDVNIEISEPVERPLLIAFNCEMLQDFVKASRSDEFQISITPEMDSGSSVSPAFIKEKDFTGLLMPIRVN